MYLLLQADINGHETFFCKSLESWVNLLHCFPDIAVISLLTHSHHFLVGILCVLQIPLLSIMLIFLISFFYTLIIFYTVYNAVGNEIHHLSFPLQTIVTHCMCITIHLLVAQGKQKIYLSLLFPHCTDLFQWARCQQLEMQVLHSLSLFHNVGKTWEE